MTARYFRILIDLAAVETVPVFVGELGLGSGVLGQSFDLVGLPTNVDP